MNNLLAIETAAITRLKATTWPELKAVYSTAEIANLRQREQPAPALHVIYDGFQIISQSGALNYRIDVRLYVIAVVQNAQGQLWMTQQGGRLMTMAAERLVGWAPTDTDFSPLRLADPPRPFYRGEYGYFPLLFLSAVEWKIPRQID